MSKPTTIAWSQIMGNPTLSRLAKRINKRFPYMSEHDILYIFEQFERADRIQAAKYENPETISQNMVKDQFERPGDAA